MKKKTGYKNILSVLDRADEIDINEGRIAYFRYNELMQKTAARYNLPLSSIVAAFAALSPNNDYKGNVRSLKTVVEAYQAGNDPKTVRVSTYGHCRDRAFLYLDGTPFLDHAKGKKIRNFYQNILNPLDPDPVTIDGHAVNIWRNQVQSVKLARNFNYKEIADDYRRAARETGLIPNQIQAITWFCWKRINRILYKPQLTLFGDPTDVWETNLNLDELKGF